MKITTTYRIAPSSEIFLESIAEIQIKKINKSINWSHYDKEIFSILQNKDDLKRKLFVALKCKESTQNDHMHIKEKIIGYVVLSEAKTLFIPFIAVKLSHQKKKVGTLLMEKMKAIAAEKKWEITFQCRAHTLGFFEKFANSKQLVLTKEEYGCYLKNDLAYKVSLIPMAG